VVDLGVLDNVIGIIVVILMLSMVVQSLQTFIKKLSSFKSRQLVKSLESLFDRTAASAPATGAASAASVLAHFKDMGRVTALNGNALESISKVDLSKVVATIEGSSLLPQKAKDSLATLLSSVQQAQIAVETLANTQLPADVVSKLADLRHGLAPLLTHVAQIVDAEGKLKGELIVQDVVGLRDFSTTDVLKIVTEIQSYLEQALAAAPADSILQKAVETSKALTKAVSDLNSKLTAVGARLSERIAAIEAWYDPIMQGFEERYSRHMKTWAFIISLVVTVALDANLPRLYKRMATDDVAKQRVLGEATKIQDRYLAQIEQARKTNDQEQLQQLIGNLNDELDEATSSYPALGLELIDIRDWWSQTSQIEKTRSIFGWLMMAFLLSLGAPFWHDALQSVFSLKNFIRERSATQNVEQATGAGNIQS
jgi:hypothetical protein